MFGTEDTVVWEDLKGDSDTEEESETGRDHEDFQDKSRNVCNGPTRVRDGTEVNGIYTTKRGLRIKRAGNVDKINVQYIDYSLTIGHMYILRTLSYVFGLSG